MVRTAFIVLSMALAGCEKEPTREELVAKQAAAKAAAKAKVAQRLAQPMEPRVIQVESGQLLVLDVPEASSSGRYVEIKRCYVWRDIEFRTASISCPGESQTSLDE